MTSLSPSRLEELKKIAEKATPGKRLVHPLNAYVVPANDPENPICAMLWPTDVRSEEETLANAELYAELDRETILALLSVLESDRKALEAFVGAHDDWQHAVKALDLDDPLTDARELARAALQRRAAVKEGNG